MGAVIIANVRNEPRPNTGLISESRDLHIRNLAIYLVLLPVGPYLAAIRSQAKEKFTMARKPRFAHHVRDARLRRGLSVADVAELVGVSTASIYLWESDRGRPRDTNLTALCKVLRLPIRATKELAAA